MNQIKPARMAIPTMGPATAPAIHALLEPAGAVDDEGPVVEAPGDVVGEPVVVAEVWLSGVGGVDVVAGGLDVLVAATETVNHTTIFVSTL